MIRYEYTDITRPPLSCSDCTKGCKSTILYRCIDASIKVQQPHKKAFLPDGDINCLKRQLVSAKSTYNMEIRSILINSLEQSKHSIKDYDTMIDILNIIEKYIIENEQKLLSNLKSLDALLNTKVILEDKEIILYSTHKEIIELCKEYVNNTWYKFINY